jgi:protein-tyrosine phosphatase
VTSWRLWAHRQSTRFYRPASSISAFSWIGGERIAIGSLPTGESLSVLAREGVTHVVNCRARLQTLVSQDLFAERATFGEGRVVHAAMWDSGQPRPASLWAAAAQFAATTLEDDPHAGVLIHCHVGRRRSVMLAYAVLRLRGHSAENAAELILTHRREAVLVPTYCASVEQWLSSIGRAGDGQQ